MDRIAELVVHAVSVPLRVHLSRVAELVAEVVTLLSTWKICI